MKRYTIKSEYLNNWGDYCTEDTIITETELHRLADEWDRDIADLLDQLIEAEPAQISVDNGANWVEPEEALSLQPFDVIVAFMDDETREAVAAEYAPCSEAEFLRHYLEAAPADLIIG